MDSSKTANPASKSERSSVSKYQDQAIYHKPHVNTDKLDMAAVESFEVFAKTSKGLTTREKIWAAETFTEFAIQFFQDLVEMVKSQEDPVCFRRMPVGVGILERVAKKLVPGFEGQVVIDWREKVGEEVKKVVEEHEFEMFLTSQIPTNDPSLQSNHTSAKSEPNNSGVSQKSVGSSTATSQGTVAAGESPYVVNLAYEAEVAGMFEQSTCLFGGFKEREKVWAASTFTKFTLAFIHNTPQSIKLVDAPGLVGYVKKLPGLMSVVQSCAEKRVPGFKGEVIAAWRVKVGDLMEKAMGQYGVELNRN